MQIYRCMNCMEEISTYPCPHCGFSGQADQNLDYALIPGRILNGKYLVGRVLGQGGFGITYIGYDLSLERKVAIKEYFPAKNATRQGATSTLLSWHNDVQTVSLRRAGLQSVLNEARKMAKLEAIPQVISVREAFEENNTAYIVMDFVEGESLKKRILRTGPMSWQEVEQLFMPLIEAMENVHQAGLVHRDISPDNLMCLKDGTIELLDLGAAKDISANQNGPSAEVVKNGFSPFEQYTMRGSSGPWSDVYAIAATIFYCLTGQIPPSAVDRVSADSINWNMPKLKKVPAAVRLALREAMAVKMNERTQSMGAFAQNLKKKHSPLQGKRKWILAVSAAAAVICLVLMIPKNGGSSSDSASASGSSAGLSSLIPGQSGEEVSYHLAKIICHPTDGEAYTSCIFTYNADGEKTETEYNQDGTLKWIREYTYFENGDIKTETFTRYDEYGEISNISYDTYNEDGSYKSESTSYQDGEISFYWEDLYDEHHERIQSKSQGYAYGKPSDYSSESIYTLEYDDHYNVIRSTTGDSSDGSEDIHTYTYDSDGNVLSEIHHSRSWHKYGSYDYTWEYHYKYDSDGNMIQWRFLQDPSDGVSRDYLEEIDDFERYPDGRVKTRTETYDGVVKYVFENIWEKTS